MRKVEKIIQTLDVEGKCLGAYYGGKFHFDKNLKDVSKKNVCWKHSSYFEDDEKNTYLHLYIANAPLSSYSSSPASLRACSELMEAQKKAAVTAKLDFSELCFYDIIPDHLLNNWFSQRESALKKVANEVPRPDNYDILHKIHVLTANISKQRLCEIRYFFFSHGQVIDRQRFLSYIEYKQKREGNCNASERHVSRA